LKVTSGIVVVPMVDAFFQMPDSDRTVIHQTPRQGTGIKPMQCATPTAQQGFAITIVQHDGLMPVTQRGQVLGCTGELDSQWSCHFQDLRKMTAQFGGGRRDVSMAWGQKARPAPPFTAPISPNKNSTR
jgi:hypothetical protein